VATTPVVNDARPDAEEFGDLGDADEIFGVVPGHGSSVRRGYDKNGLRMIMRTMYGENCA
jgi:hypothetical protein